MFYLSIIYILFNCYTNCFAMNCWHERDILEFNCGYNTDFSSNFLQCENKKVAHENVTDIIINGCQVNAFPTEMFGIIHNVKKLAIKFPQFQLLSKDNFIGANQLQKLSFTGGEFNLSASIFANAPELKVLNIVSTDVGFIDPQAFSGASGLRTLRLKIKMKAEFPKGLFDDLVNLEVLDLFRYNGSTKYNEVDMEALRFPAGNKIKLFNLGDGHIIELKAEMFANLTSLTMLLLPSNNIQRIQPYTFVNLNRLILLELRRNVIQQLAKAMLMGLTNLRAADFSENQIYYIESEAFSGMLHLRRLDLTFNRLRTFEPYLNGLLKLRHLDLSYNGNYNDELLTVDLSMFCNLPNLSYLNLSFMRISKLRKCTETGTVRPTSPDIQFDTNETVELLSEWNDLKITRAFYYNIDVGYIDGMSHENRLTSRLTLLDERQNKSANDSRLAVLDLVGNELSDLDDNIFGAFVNLRILDLNGNMIESLRSEQFNGLENLETLYIYNCKLTSLDFNVLSPPTSSINRLDFVVMKDYMTDKGMFKKVFKNGFSVQNT